MIETVKSKLWQLLQKKEASLVMLLNRQGDILWHEGRPIKGERIQEGEGFSKSFLEEAMVNSETMEEKNVVIASQAKDLPKSARFLNIKSLMVQPVGGGYFLYFDSGTKDPFNRVDTEVLKTVGGLLGEMINKVGYENLVSRFKLDPSD